LELGSDQLTVGSLALALALSRSLDTEHPHVRAAEIQLRLPGNQLPLVGPSASSSPASLLRSRRRRRSETPRDF